MVPSYPELNYKPLIVDERKIQYLWQKNLEFPFVFDDLSYGDFENFMRTLVNPRNVFFELGDGDGLVTFTEVQPHVNASLHFIFYDGHIKGKEKVTKAILRDMFQLAKLRRITCGLPDDRATGLKFIKRLGFKKEGLMRKSFLRNRTYMDIEIFGLLAEEL